MMKSDQKLLGGQSESQTSDHECYQTCHHSYEWGRQLVARDNDQR